MNTHDKRDVLALRRNVPGVVLRRILRQFPRRHVYFFQIYSGFLSILIAFAALVVFMIWSFTDRATVYSSERLMVLADMLLPADATPVARREALEALASVTSGNVALLARDGSVIDGVGTISAGVMETIARAPGCSSAAYSGYWAPKPCTSESVPIPTNVPYSPGPFSAGALRDGRRLVIDWHASLAQPRPHGILAVVALITAMGAYPIARRLSRRVEALQRQANALEQGKLSARVAVKGHDEIAELARRFNRAAERVETVVSNQRAILAAASHELRSPLARIRLASSLLGSERPELQAQIARDIAELDGLISDLLLASSLAGDNPPLNVRSVDLLGLVAEEGCRIGASLVGQIVELQGDPRLLRHLVRNLLENARRHAAGSPIEIEVTRADRGDVIVRVLDHGPGVPEDERERIFEPFYRPQGSRENGEGVGYGLALVRRVARLHHGEARCLGRPGGGACFEVTLPAG